MTKTQLRNLHEGDCIQSELTGINYLVTGNYGDRVTAVQTVDVTHADEWRLVYTVLPQATRTGRRRTRSATGSTEQQARQEAIVAPAPF